MCVPNACANVKLKLFYDNFATAYLTWIINFLACFNIQCVANK